MSEALRYISFDASEFLADTRALSDAQRGMYISLICSYFLGGCEPLANENPILARLAGTGLKTWLKNRPSIERLFRIDIQGWHHESVKLGYEKALLRVDKAKRARAQRGGGKYLTPLQRHSAQVSVERLRKQHLSAHHYGNGKDKEGGNGLKPLGTALGGSYAGKAAQSLGGLQENPLSQGADADMLSLSEQAQVPMGQFVLLSDTEKALMLVKTTLGLEAYQGLFSALYGGNDEDHEAAAMQLREIAGDQGWNLTGIE